MILALELAVAVAVAVAASSEQEVVLDDVVVVVGSSSSEQELVVLVLATVDEFVLVSGQSVPLGTQRATTGRMDLYAAVRVGTAT